MCVIVVRSQRRLLCSIALPKRARAYHSSSSEAALALCRSSLSSVGLLAASCRQTRACIWSLSYERRAPLSSYSTAAFYQSTLRAIQLSHGCAPRYTSLQSVPSTQGLSLMAVTMVAVVCLWRRLAAKNPQRRPMARDGSWPHVYIPPRQSVRRRPENQQCETQPSMAPRRRTARHTSRDLFVPDCFSTARSTCRLRLFHRSCPALLPTCRCRSTRPSRSLGQLRACC